MCRSIRTLRDGAEMATEDEIRAAALQYVRKVSGFRAPSTRHQAAFDAAVEEVASASERLLREVSAALRGRARLEIPQEAGGADDPHPGVLGAAGHESGDRRSRE